jgi:predicted Zn-dependent protease
MKHHCALLFFLITLWTPSGVFSQDSIPVTSNLKEEKLLKFQDHFFKALAQKSIFNYRVAIQELEKCNELKPKDASVLFELSKNYLFLKKFLEAETYANQALVVKPNNYWILEHLSEIYITSRNIKKAIPVQEKIALQNSKGKERLVYLYYQNNQLEKAKKVLAEIEKMNQLTRGLVLLKKRFQKRVQKKEIIIKEEPLKAENLQSLILKFDTNKNFDTLRKILTLSADKEHSILFTYSKKGLELFPAQAFVYLMHAKALNIQEKYQKAISQLQNGIDFVIDNKMLEADFYEELAFSYSHLGKKKEAIKNKNKALVLRKK